MDHAANLGLSDGRYIILDGDDTLFFYDEIPNHVEECKVYSMVQDRNKYYNALNNLARYNYVGIKKEYTDHESAIEYAGKEYVYVHYYKNIDKKDEHNEIIYIKTSAISTIALM